MFTEIKNRWRRVFHLSTKSVIQDETDKKHGIRENVNGSEEQPLHYAGFWRRAIACALDIFVFLMGIQVVMVTVLFRVFEFQLREYFSDLDYDTALYTAYYMWLFFVYPLVFIAYFSCLECSRYRSTLGKYVLKCYVGSKEGAQITFMRSLKRAFIFLIIGAIASAFVYFTSVYTFYYFDPSILDDNTAIKSSTELIARKTQFLVLFATVLFLGLVAKGKKVSVIDQLSTTRVFMKKYDKKGNWIKQYTPAVTQQVKNKGEIKQHFGTIATLVAMLAVTIGIVFYMSYGIEYDYAKDYQYYIKDAERGDASAQFELGFLYDEGSGVDRDYMEAHKWYLKAAEQGHVASQKNLGSLYQYGNGVEQDYGEAHRWYLAAAKQGYDRAQYVLALLYYNGDGVEQDYEEARKWWSKAAEQGDSYSQSYLDLLDDRGKEVEL